MKHNGIDPGDSRSSQAMQSSTELNDAESQFFVCRFHANGKITYSNKSFSDFLGKPESLILGKNFQSYISSNEQLSADSFIKKISSGSKQNIFRFYMKSGDGNNKWSEWKFDLIPSKNGKSAEYLAIGKDITDYKILEGELEKILLAVQQSKSVVVITDINGNIEYVNPQFTELTGYTFEEVKGKSPGILKSGKTSKEEYQVLWETILMGKEWKGEFCNRKKDGTLFWESASISPVKDELGKITNFIAVKEDITEKKDNQKLQEAIYNISKVVISNPAISLLYREIHKILAEVLPVENFYIALYDEKTNLVSFPYFVDEFDEPSPPQPPGKGLTEYVLKTGEPLLATSEVFSRLVELGEVDLVGTDSLDWIGVPLKIHNKTIGVIVIQSYSEKIKLTKRELDILKYVSDQIALAIERASNHEALIDSEEKYRGLFDQAADLIALIDVKGNLLDVNQRFSDISGWPKKEILGKNIFACGIITQASSVRTAFYFSRLLLNKEIPLFEIEGITREKKIIPYELKAVPVYKDGKINVIQVIFRDLSERKRTEEKLKFSEQRLSNLMSNLPGMAYRCAFDRDWTMEFLSQGCFDLTGYTQEELIRNNKLSFNDIILPDDRETVWNDVSEAISKNKSYKMIYRIQTKSGKQKWVWEKGNAIFSEDGNVEALEGFISDITDRIEVEEALKENEELYRKLIATLPDMIFITDLNCNILFVNEIGIKLCGYERFDQLKRTNILSLISESDKHKASEYFSSFAEINPGAKEFQIQSKSGEIIFVEVQGEVLKNHEQISYGFIFSCKNITQRMLAENALAQSEKQYRTLVDSIQDGVFLIQKGKINFVNKAFADMIGYEVDEIIGTDFTVFVAPEDLEMVKSNYYKRLNGENPPASYEWRMLHKNGSRVIVNMSVRIIGYQGGLASIGTIKDVTRLKKDEEILRKQNELFKGIVAASKSLLSENDFNSSIDKTLQSLGEFSKVDRVYIFKNNYTNTSSLPTMSQTNEWTSGLVSKEINNPLLQNLPYEKNYLRWYELLVAGNIVSGLVKDFSYNEKELLEQEGILSIIIVPIKAKNQFWGFIGFDDCHTERIWSENEIAMIQAAASNIGTVIEREMARQELIKAKEVAEEMNRLKSTFLANMSHELRTPLIGILGYTEILLNEISDPEYNSMLDTVMQSGKRLLETLNLILDLSKIESDNFKIEYEKLDLRKELQEVVSLLSPMAKKKNLYLQEKIKKRNLYVRMDKRMLHSILKNVISNGIKYTNDGGVTVELDTFLKDNMLYARIDVIDTGIGISREGLEVIFDEFRQVSEGYNRQFEGAGLGLTIAKRFLDKVGGSISVQSQVNKGSVFEILIPLTDTGLILDQNDEEDISKSTDSIRVLAIDDDRSSRNIITMFLRHINVDTAATAEEAFNKINESTYSLILMDISLGKGLSGIDMLRQIRQIAGAKQIPAIAVTAHAMVGDRERFLAEGFNDYLSKPFSKKALVEKVDFWLGKKQADQN
ncbi:MAG: PAS domain S-box protein [Ignavibacteriaceae bacterium]|nr:PAS domain S-box protein [Ignavibacteriaceae bacterium]